MRRAGDDGRCEGRRDDDDIVSDIGDESADDNNGGGGGIEWIGGEGGEGGKEEGGMQWNNTFATSIKAGVGGGEGARKRMGPR